HTGGESGPCNRRKRGECGAESTESALLLQAAEIGQLAGGHELLEKLRIQSVQTQENQFLNFGVLVSLLPGDQSLKHANRPQQQRNHTQEETDKQREEGPEKSKS